MYYRGVSSRTTLLFAVPIVILVIGVLLWSLFGQGETLRLMPALPDPTAVQFGNDQSPAAVSFSELNNDPIAYLNQTIVVSGNYLPVQKADCLRYSGPDIRWSLTAENLQLDALGYERIVRLIPQGTLMTVQGIWHLYEGPLGCGKGPPDGTAWYLDVKKIILPNPLVGKGGQAIPIIIEDGQPGLPDLIPTPDIGDLVPTATNEIVTVTVAGTEVVPPTPESQATFTATPTPDGVVPLTATAQQTLTPLAPTQTSIAGTSVPGATATAEATNDPNNPTATLTPELPPVLATATENPDGGYPGPEETMTPTITPDPYP